MQRGGPGPFWSAPRSNNRRRDTYSNAMAMRVVFALVQQVMAMEHKPPVTLLLAAGTYFQLLYKKPLEFHSSLHMMLE